MNNMSTVSADNLGPVKWGVSLSVREWERSLSEKDRDAMTEYEVVDMILAEFKFRDIFISYGDDLIFIEASKVGDYISKELSKKYKEYKELPTTGDMVTDALGVLYDSGYHLVSGRI